MVSGTRRAKIMFRVATQSLICQLTHILQGSQAKREKARKSIDIVIKVNTQRAARVQQNQQDVHAKNLKKERK